jgi:hypothetical protein
MFMATIPCGCKNPWNCTLLGTSVTNPGFIGGGCLVTVGGASGSPLCPGPGDPAGTTPTTLVQRSCRCPATGSPAFATLSAAEQADCLSPPGTPTPTGSPSASPSAAPSASPPGPSPGPSAAPSASPSPPPFGPVCPGDYLGWTPIAPYFCRASKPSTEFYYGGTPVLSPYPGGPYPMCGAGRVPVTGDGNYTWMNVSSSAEPKSSQLHCYCGGGSCSYSPSPSCPASEMGPQFSHSFIPPSGTLVNDLKYMYSGLTRCACIGKTVAATPLSGTPTPSALSSTLPNGKPRLYPDTYDVISAQTDAAGEKYGMVAIAYDGTSDGRNGDRYKAGDSFCGCPNVNEEMVNNDSSPTSGVQCVPAFNDPKRVFVNYDPVIHDGARTQVIDRNFGGISPSNGKVVKTILLPAALSNQTATQVYQRKIWACRSPYTLNPSTKKCEFRREDHACNEGDPGTGVEPSEVSSSVSGVTKRDRFLNVVNKKLACCLNEFGSTISTVKFDCVDNSMQTQVKFDDLWSSSDQSIDGGQLNALILSNSMGKTLTGFYTLDGTRCNEFSEFAGVIQPGRVNPSVLSSGVQMNHANQKVKTDEFEEVGMPLELPTAAAYTLIKNNYTGKGLKTPSTVGERRRCPILVRAALVVQCPKNPVPPATQRTVELTNASGQVTDRMCSRASAAQVHIRVEQVTEIAGMPKMKVEDTVVDQKNAATISIERIIANKYGNLCPLGSHRSGDACVED